MPKLNQQGAIQFIILFLLLAGIGVGVYLITTGNLKLFSKAACAGTRLVIAERSATSVPDCQQITKTSSKNVKLKLIYVAPSATPASSPFPSSTPAAAFTNLSASLEKTKATFNFAYLDSKETLYKVHLSKTAEFGWGVFGNFVTGSNSPLINSTPSATWSDYSCGKTYWWRAEAVYTGGIVSPIQGPLTVACPVGIGSTATIGVGGSVKGIGTTAPQTANFPTHFRVANSPAELATATEQVFDMNGKVIDWMLTSGNIQKTVYAEFKVNNVWTSKVSATVTLDEPISSPTPSSSPATEQTQQIKVFLIAYYPKQASFPSLGTDPAAWTKNTLLPAINESTKYQGYKNPAATPALNYTLAEADIRIENSPPPTRPDNYLSGWPRADYQPGYLDYPAIFKKYDLCNYAKQNDIKAVMIWQTGGRMFVSSGTEVYSAKDNESNITGNKGIPTNGTMLKGPQYCDDKTIAIYGFDYGRGLSEALESYGHHLERVFGQFRGEYGNFSDRDSCGNDHNPPNYRFEYDRSNASSFQSDCRNWKADGTGTKEALNCDTWGCDGAGWLKWWMQNMPGLGNTLSSSNGQKIPNWWVYIGDPDNCYNNPLGCNTQQTHSPSPTPTLIPCTPCSADVDKDTRVNWRDFSRISACFNKTIDKTGLGSISCRFSDIDGNGIVNAADFTCFRSQYSKRCPSNQRDIRKR